MDKPNYQVRPLTSEHVEAIANLYRLAFKKEPNLDLLRWKYFGTPAGDAKLSGIFSEDELVGSGALLPEQMSVFGEAQRVYKCTDLMVHPSHRKRGLAKMIIDSLKSSITIDGKISLSYTMCSKIATYGFAKNNYVKLSNIYNPFKPIAVVKINQLFSGAKRLYSSGTLQKSDAIPDGLSSFEFSTSPDKIEVKKSLDYLQWRIKNPKFKYTTISYLEGDAVVGYVIVGLGKSNLLNIIDSEVKNNDRKVLKSLLGAA